MILFYKEYETNEVMIKKEEIELRKQKEKKNPKQKDETSGDHKIQILASYYFQLINIKCDPLPSK